MKGDMAHIINCTDTNVPIHNEGPQNGVERFLGQLREWSEQKNMPLHMIAPGTGEAKNLRRINVPTFTIPGYPWLYAAYPLAHHRKEMMADMQKIATQTEQGVVHISTPGPFGMAARFLAVEQHLPIVGIHHTDFGGYAKQHLLQHTLSPHATLDELLEPILEALPGLKEEGSLLHELRQMFEAMQRIRIQLRSGTIQNIRRSPLKALSWWLALQILPGSRDIMQLQRDVSILGQGYRTITEKITGEEPSSILLANTAEKAVNQYLRWFYSPFSIVIARSVQQQQALRDDIGIEEERIRLLTPAINTSFFKAANRRVPHFWQEVHQLHIPAESSVVLYVGRITQEKNIHFLANVWKELCKHTLNLKNPPHFVLVGRAVPEELERVLELSGKHNIHHIGHLDGEGLLAVYENSDLFWSASPTETFGQVGAEAGAMGLPTIVSNEGGLQTIVKHKKTGFVLPINDKKAIQTWATTTQELLSSTIARQEMSSAARAHIEKTYAWEASMQSYQDIHKEAAHLAPKQTKDDTTHVLTPAVLEQHFTDSVLFCSDFHAGKDNKEKILAFPKIMEFAVEQNARIVYGGDFGDHDMDSDDLEKDMQLIRKAQQQLNIDPEDITFLRGNHDYGFSDTQIHTWLDGCTIHHSLVAVDTVRGVAMTHGHIYGLDEVIAAFQKNNTVEGIEADTTESVLQEPLKPAIVAHDFSSSILKPLAKRGIYLQDFWESVSAKRADIAEWILPSMEFAQKDSKQGMRRLLANLISPRNDATNAALFGVATGCWVSIYGHTHDEELKKITVQHPQTKKPTPVLVANSGKMYGSHPTCIIAQFPNVHIVRWNKEEQSWHSANTLSLTSEEIEEYYSTYNKK